MFKNIFKNNTEKTTEQVEQKPQKSSQKVIRVYTFSDLHLTPAGFSFWHSEYTKDPEVISKIYNYLKTASTIRLYVSRDYIEYSAETERHGQVNGGCHRAGYGFFEFGIRRSGHRWDFYGDDRNDPKIKEFYDWWKNLVRPYEIEFDNDYNL